MEPAIYVDLDATLAHYNTGDWAKPIGEPIMPMLNRVYRWLEEGKKVKIFTARAGLMSDPSKPDEVAIASVKAWLAQFDLEHLEVTHYKGMDGVEFWDDRAVQIIPNTGRRADGVLDGFEE